MSFQTPDSKCSTYIEGLGKLDGLQYANGVQQYCGIPFAKLPKRWTRSTLNVSWENDYHDGTKQGEIAHGQHEFCCLHLLTPVGANVRARR